MSYYDIRRHSRAAAGHRVELLFLQLLGDGLLHFLAFHGLRLLQVLFLSIDTMKEGGGIIYMNNCFTSDQIPSLEK